MKPEIKKIWLEALRSGNYKQCKRKLRSEDKEPSYCCLGVLSDLAVKQGVCNERTAFYDEDEEIPMLTLSDKVREWAGFEEDNPYLREGDSAGYLNDSYQGGLSFKQIADIIESNL